MKLIHWVTVLVFLISPMPLAITGEEAPTSGEALPAEGIPDEADTVDTPDEPEQEIPDFGRKPVDAGTIKFDGQEYPLSMSRISEDRDVIDAFGHCRLTLTFPLPSEKWIKTRLEIDAAADDSGRDMIDEKIEELAGDLDLSTDNTRTEFDLSLKQSNRSAKTIKQVKGRLILQNRDAKKNTLVLKNFLATPGEYLGNEALKEHGIRVAYLNEDTFEDKGSSLVMERMKGEGSLYDSAPGVLEAAVSNFKNVISMSGMKTVLIDAPDDSILRVEAVVSSTGKRSIGNSAVMGMYMFHSGEMAAKAMGKEPPQYDELHITLKSKGAEKAAEFVIENVTLP